jgi:hypothetical protein
MNELIANFITRTSRTSPRLLHPLQNPPPLASKGQGKSIISQAKLKRFISEAYFGKTVKACETTLGLPAVSPKVLKPRRELADQRHKLPKVACPPHKRTRMPYKASFGYVTGRRIEQTDQGCMTERRTLEIRLPQSPRETDFTDECLTSPVSLKDQPSKSYESIPSKASDSKDRINIGVALRHCIGLQRNKPMRRVIYQSLAAKV